MMIVLLPFQLLFFSFLLLWSGKLEAPFRWIGLVSVRPLAA